MGRGRGMGGGGCQARLDDAPREKEGMGGQKMDDAHFSYTHLRTSSLQTIHPISSSKIITRISCHVKESFLWVMWIR